MSKNVEYDRGVPRFGTRGVYFCRENGEDWIINADPRGFIIKD